MRPALVPYPGEIAPYRLVGDELVATKGIGEDFFTDRLRLLDALVLEAVCVPRRRVAFDEERAHVRRIAVVMSIEGAALGRHKSLRQRRKSFCRAVPGELVGGMGN